MTNHMCKVIFLLALFFSNYIEAKEDIKNYDEKYYESLDLTEIKLQNGLTIFLKSTNFDKNEVYIQLLAPYGYSNLPKENRPAGILSSKIAFESGVGKYIGHELPYKLYNESIDLHFSIERSHRIIDITTPPESINNALLLVQSIFEENNISEKAVEKILDKEKAHMSDNISNNPIKNLETASMSLNTNNHYSIRPLSFKEIGKVDTKNVNEVFNSLFSDPSEFSAIIIGDIDVPSVKKFVIERLSSIEKKKVKNCISFNSLPSFPKGITRKVIPSEQIKDSFSRITLPINLTFTKENIEMFQLLTHILEKRIRKVILQETGKNFGIDIEYEIPIYPIKNTIWLNIQYHSEKNQMQYFEKLIIRELEFLANNEIKKEELNFLIEDQKNSDNFWKKTNSYWQSKLANYCLWNWEIDFNESIDIYQVVTPKLLRDFVKKSIDLKNYSVVTIK